MHSMMFIQANVRKLLEVLSIANVTTADDEPEWVVKHAKAERRKEFLDKKKLLEERLQKVRDKEAQQRRQYEKGEPIAKRQVRCSLWKSRRLSDQSRERPKIPLVNTIKKSTKRQNSFSTSMIATRKSNCRGMVCHTRKCCQGLAWNWPSSTMVISFQGLY